MAELTESPTLDDLADALTGHGGFVAELISHIIGTVESNSNGFYVRLGNGWQVAWTHTALPYGSGPGAWTFPVPFIEEPVVHAFPRRSDGTAAHAHGRTGATATSATIERSGAPSTVAALAIGKWK